MTRDEPMEPIHVTYAVDREFALPLRVALTSTAWAHPAGTVTTAVVHNGLDPAIITELGGEVAGRMHVDFVQVDQRQVAGAHHSTFLTPASLYRILLPEVLSCRRTIYLDADTVTRTSLLPLWRMSLDGKSTGAVREAQAPWAAGPMGTDWRDLGMSPDTAYFNSGVLLIDLDAWRREGIGPAALDVLRRTRPRWGDQCALNAVLGGRWLELPRRWNLQTADAAGRGIAWALWRGDVEAALADPAVVHYSERIKPWHAAPQAHPLAPLWFDQLERTALSGWAPEPPRKAFVRRAARRVQRAMRVLTGAE